MSATRREILIRGGAVTAGAALPSLFAAAPALAQQSEETDAIGPVVELEQAAELAYALAAEEAGGPAGELLRDLGTHAGEHATALAEALDQLGVDPPDASEDPATYDSLRGFDDKASEREQLDFFIGLEEELVRAYEEAVEALESSTIVLTWGQIAAAHAQALVALRLEAGAAPGGLTALPAAGAGEQ